MSCGNCSKHCEMGIDVRRYAQRGQDVVWTKKTVPEDLALAWNGSCEQEAQLQRSNG